MLEEDKENFNDLNSPREMFATLAFLGELGLVMVGSIAIMLWLSLILMKKAQLGEWVLLPGFLIGITAGFYSIGKIIKKRGILGRNKNNKTDT